MIATELWWKLAVQFVDGWRRRIIPAVAKKQSKPVLYELLGGRESSRSVPAVESEREKPEPRKDVSEVEPAATPSNSGHPTVSDGHGLAWLGAGRTVRLPVGYIFLAIAAAVILTAVSYSIGVAAGQEKERQAHSLNRDAQAEANRVMQQLGGSTAQRPAGDRTSGDAPISRNGQRTPSDQAQTPSTPRHTTPRAGTAGAIESDPREPGLNYFVLIHTTRDNAIEMAAFCRERGLEAYVVPGNNTWSKVFVLPGFRGDELRSDRALNLREQILSVGRDWSARAPGNRDFHGHYAERYQGR